MSAQTICVCLLIVLVNACENRKIELAPPNLNNIQQQDLNLAKLHAEPKTDHLRNNNTQIQQEPGDNVEARLKKLAESASNCLTKDYKDETKSIVMIILNTCFEKEVESIVNCNVGLPKDRFKFFSKHFHDGPLEAMLIQALNKRLEQQGTTLFSKVHKNVDNTIKLFLKHEQVSHVWKSVFVYDSQEFQLTKDIRNKPLELEQKNNIQKLLSAIRLQYEAKILIWFLDNKSEDTKFFSLHSEIYDKYVKNLKQVNIELGSALAQRISIEARKRVGGCKVKGGVLFSNRDVLMLTITADFSEKESVKKYLCFTKTS